MFVEEMSAAAVERLRSKSVWGVLFRAAALFAVFGAMAAGCGWLAYWLSGLDDGGTARGLIVFLPAFFLVIASIGFGLMAFALSIGLVFAHVEAKAQEQEKGTA